MARDIHGLCFLVFNYFTPYIERFARTHKEVANEEDFKLLLAFVCQRGLCDVKHELRKRGYGIIQRYPG